jgi:hypothetical protein
MLYSLSTRFKLRISSTRRWRNAMQCGSQVKHLPFVMLLLRVIHATDLDSENVARVHLDIVTPSKYPVLCGHR